MLNIGPADQRQARSRNSFCALQSANSPSPASARPRRCSASATRARQAERRIRRLSSGLALGAAGGEECSERLSLARRCEERFMTEATNFRTMDESTTEDWQRVAQSAGGDSAGLADLVLAMLERLRGSSLCMPVDPYEHSLQT